MRSHLLLLDYTKTTCQLIFTCFNFEGGDRVIKDTKYSIIFMIYWNMYLPNILVVYTLMKNIFYLKSIKSDSFKII